MTRMTLLVLVDGLRHDYVNAVDAPFLAALGTLNPSGAVRETFAFQLRPAFFAGLQPEQCGVAHLYCYDPEHSPYRELPDEANDRATIMSYVRQVERARGHSASALYADPFAIPRPLLHYFNFSELRLTTESGVFAPYPTLFDLLREAGHEWLWIAYPTHDQRTEQILAFLMEHLKPSHRFVFLHFAELDWAGHEGGPCSIQQRECLRKIDRALASVYALLNQRFSHVDSVVFGDHGMVAVRHLVDIESVLKELDIAIGEEYVYFLDSTQARFWFRSGRARQVVTSALEKLPGGAFLSESDLATLRFRFPDHRFGELIWVVDDEHAIFPNFFQRQAPPRGMHGYLPAVSGNWGWLCITGACPAASWEQPAELTRIFPTLVQMLGLRGTHPDQEQRPLILLQEASLSASPDVSVVIPTRNRASALAECLQALGGQDFPHERMEIIVVDDGSEDHTSDVVACCRQKVDIALSYDRIQPSGPAAARNCGVRLARGRIVLFIGDDIIASPTLVATHIRHHEHTPFSHAVLGQVTWHPQLEITPFMAWLENGGPQFSYRALEKSTNIGFGAFWTCNISLKLDFMRTHGLFDEQFTAAVWEDIELGGRLDKVGLQIEYAPDALAYHKHPVSLKSYTQRQRQAGYFAALMLDRCPELEQDILRRAWLGNPLLLFDEEVVQALVRRVEEADLGAEPDTRMYEAILAWFFAQGLRQGLEEIGLPTYAQERWPEDYLLNRVLPPRCLDQAAPPCQPSPASQQGVMRQGVWTALGEHFQWMANQAYARLPSPLARFYMKLRRYIIGW